MTEFQFHNLETAPEAARPILQKSLAQLGFIPNLHAGLANSPAVLDAYIGISACFEKTSLSPAERQIVLLAVSVANGCDFCSSAHSMIAQKMVGVPEAVIQAVLHGNAPPDRKLAALAELALAIVEERGWINEHPAFTRFLEAGYQPEQALEVILGVTQKTLSNYANHLLKTPINPELLA